MRDKVFRRFALAVAASALLHVVIAVVMRPDYREVRDRVGLREIVDLGIEQGRRPAPTPAAPESRFSAPPPVPEPPKVAPKPKPRPKEKSPESVTLPPTSTDSAPPSTDSAPPDTAPDMGTALESTDTGTGDSTDSGAGGTDTGQGESLCLHDLFSFAEGQPTWALWISMVSLRGTVFEQEVSRALEAFEYTRRLEQNTGLEPGSDIEGLLVTSRDVNDWRTYEVMATYDSGEERLRSRLMRTMGSKPGAVVVRTPAGWEINVPGEQRYHLLGSGRVLLTAYSEPLQSPNTPSTDTGSTVLEKTLSGARHQSHGDNPAWPKQVECLASSLGLPDTDPTPRSPLAFDAQSARTALLRTVLRPLLYANEDGRVPVMAMATTDPRAMGLGRGNLKGGLKVGGAVLRAYFGQKVRFEALVSVDGDPAAISALRDAWKARIDASAQDTFLRMTGLSGVLPRIEVSPVEKGITLSVTLSAAEVRAALVFLQMQGEVLSRSAAN